MLRDIRRERVAVNARLDGFRDGAERHPHRDGRLDCNMQALHIEVSHERATLRVELRSSLNHQHGPHRAGRGIEALENAGKP